MRHRAVFRLWLHRCPALWLEWARYQGASAPPPARALLSYALLLVHPQDGAWWDTAAPLDVRSLRDAVLLLEARYDAVLGVLDLVLADPTERAPEVRPGEPAPWYDWSDAAHEAAERFAARR